MLVGPNESRTMSRAITTAKDILKAMAYSRETFKDRVEEKIGGGLLEYYKAALARLSRQTRWVKHWESEAERLINIELGVVLLHSIKGFRDRKKAVQEVLDHLREIDHQYRRAAQYTIQRDYGLKKLRTQITDQDTENFYRMVQRTIDTHT